ncbi:MAG: sulfatase-like hydrolase/transferase [Bacteroidetes bacterium]|nr:sulfatase-like hydrolase/transferase [Bacteroidota bacterium]
MKYSKNITIGVFLFVINLCVLAIPQNISAEEKPNVIFIVCDDLNDYSGAFAGHSQVKTPNIDKLAKSGVTFVNAQSNCPLCSPSRNSLFTGVYSYKSKDFGLTNLSRQPVLKHNKTLMEYYTENGYHVMGSGKLLHTNRKEYWDEWGVDVNNYGPFAFDGTNQVGHPSVPEPFRSIGDVDGSYAPLSDVPVFPESETDGKKTGWIYSKPSGKMLNYIDENNRDLLPDELHAQWAARRLKEMDEEGFDKPFFMGIGFVRPHTPLYAPKRFFDMFPLEDIELSPIKNGDVDDTYYRDIYPVSRSASGKWYSNTSKGVMYFRILKESYGGDEEDGLKHFVQAYLACVAFVDEQIGKVVEAVDNSKFKDNTIIVLTSDHGWQMGEKEYLFKNSPWEESTRIPLIIRAPEAKAGASVDHPVSLIDLFPTLSDLCGLTGDNRKSEEGGPIGGFSLNPFLKNPKTKNWEGPEGALSMIADGLNRKEAGKQTYSYRTKDWRYILYMDGREELYDHKNDPYEWTNLADDKKFEKRKKILRNLLRELVIEIPE